MKTLLTSAIILAASTTAFADSVEFNGINGAELYASQSQMQYRGDTIGSQPAVGSAELGGVIVTGQSDFWSRYGDQLDRNHNQLK